MVAKAAKGPGKIDMNEETMEAALKYMKDQKAGKGEDFNMSKEEEDRFTANFKDPKFRAMLNDYMEEISDPKHRAESEQYITQLESEKKVPEGKALLRPEPGFVIKTSFGEKKEKMFINITKNASLGQPVRDRTGDGKMSVNLPHIVGAVRTEKDTHDTNVTTLDVCFHPAAIISSTMSDEMKDFLVVSAIESAERQYRLSSGLKDVEIDRKYRVLKGVKYKSGEPPTMIYRIADTEKKSQADSTAPVTAATSSSTSTPSSQSAPGDTPAPTLNSTASTADTSTNAGGAPSAAKPKSTAAPAVKRGFLQNNKKAVTPKYNNDKSVPNINNTGVSEGMQSVPSKTNTGENNIHSNDVDNKGGKAPLDTVSNTVPEKKEHIKPITQVSTTTRDNAPGGVPKQKARFTMVESGVFDIASHTIERAVPVRNRPRMLIFRIPLPEGVSAKQVDLQVGERRLQLGTPADPLYIDTVLPYPVDDKLGSAKYDKGTRQLTVTVPVKPPPAPVPVERSAILSAEREENSAEQDGVKEDGHAEKDPIATDDSTQNSDSTLDKTTTNTLENVNKQDHSRWVSPAPPSEKFDFPAPALLATPGPDTDVEVPPVAVHGSEGSDSTTSSTSDSTNIDKDTSTCRENISEPTTGSISDVRGIEETDVENLDENFIPSLVWGGQKPGFYFSKGDKGVGYYKVRKLSTSNFPIDTPSSSEKSSEKNENLPKPAYKWRQNIDNLSIIIDVGALDASKESVFVKWGPKSLDMLIKTRDGTSCRLELSLSGEVNPAKSRFDVATNNIAVVLYKVTEAYWDTLEGPEEDPLDAKSSVETSSNAKAQGTSGEISVPGNIPERDPGKIPEERSAERGPEERSLENVLVPPGVQGLQFTNKAMFELE